MLEVLISAALFSVFGIICEVFFTAIYNAFETRGKSWKGEVSILMFPVYFFSYLLMAPLLVKLFSILGIGILLQCIAITCLIYAAEYTAGVVYEKFGQRPWFYNHAWQIFGWKFRLDLNNKITLLYLPFWLIFSLIALKFNLLLVLLFHMCTL